MIKNFKEFKELVDSQLILKETFSGDCFNINLNKLPYEVIYRYVADEISREILESIQRSILNAKENNISKDIILIILQQECAKYLDLSNYKS